MVRKHPKKTVGKKPLRSPGCREAHGFNRFVDCAKANLAGHDIHLSAAIANPQIVTRVLGLYLAGNAHHRIP